MRQIYVIYHVIYFYRSEIYYRLCKYYANQIDTSIHSVIPNYSLVEDNDKDSILQSYEATLNVLDDMHIQYEVFKSAVVKICEKMCFMLVRIIQKAKVCFGFH